MQVVGSGGAFGYAESAKQYAKTLSSFLPPVLQYRGEAEVLTHLSLHEAVVVADGPLQMLACVGYPPTNSEPAVAAVWALGASGAELVGAWAGGGEPTPLWSPPLGRPDDFSSERPLTAVLEPDGRAVLVWGQSSAVRPLRTLRLREVASAMGASSLGLVIAGGGKMVLFDSGTLEEVHRWACGGGGGGGAVMLAVGPRLVAVSASRDGPPLPGLEDDEPLEEAARVAREYLAPVTIVN